MGHDISGFNQAGVEIAYARFSMGNHNALILYRLLEAFDYYAGVSGSGRGTTFTIRQIEKALQDFNQDYTGSSHSQDNFMKYDGKQILDFIRNCLATAQKEGSVKVYFG
ncbi:hypothetical protein DRW41_11495 [Neobacillus piezotolerans]|uniref:Uncharacterized protein n=1 Tax=Neobacillus piezotolerans TaxID=2259171 RepID=A0A3D8GQA6_9BACI|nr:hypothetical protein [Neobacillus piezotolerans]RDU36675.1 hypothetical protein DRW41_11495 [Neobacillus piezotolerans]